MFKSHLHDQTWLVQQHHHALISGYLAAHWGGTNGFARPGHYAGADNPAAWRDEVILAIAEHDNGWWEWEAMPRISDRDGLPVGLGEAAAPTPTNELTEWRTSGFERWRLGINRIAPAHPYGALLISLHAYWLYAVAFDDLTPADAAARRHFVFGAPDVAAGLVGDREKTRAFLKEMADTQAALKRRLEEDTTAAAAIEPRHLDPHLRLLQLMDSLSIYLALNDPDDHELHEIPRASWDDRCSIHWKRRDAGTIALSPYPFDQDPLPVHLPVREIPADRARGEDTPYALLHGTPLRTVEVSLVSG